MLTGFLIKLAALAAAALATLGAALFSSARANEPVAPIPRPRTAPAAPLTSPASAAETDNAKDIPPAGSGKKPPAASEEQKQNEIPGAGTEAANTLPPKTETAARSAALPQLPSPPEPQPEQAIEIPPPASPAPSWDEINRKTRAALVNIICTTKRGGYFDLVSGSGVVIDPRGIILTNAHVAQYLLLKDYLIPDFLTCTIRTGEPAQNRYRARLLYISPRWVKENYKNIARSDQTGTGENDFALLVITESVNPETLPLPDSFSFLPLDFTDRALRGKDQILVAGYPAGALGGINIQKDFYPASSIASISRVYSFRGASPDLFSIFGNMLAQHGSSGGAVVSSEQKLIGLLVTATDAPTTGERELNAVTAAYLSRAFAEENGAALEAWLAENDPSASADTFASGTAPQLTKLLTDELNR